MYKEFEDYTIELFFWKPFIKIYFKEPLNRMFLAGWPRIGEEKDRNFIWINRLKQ